MRNYGAADLARSFRVVRANTIRVAKDIPESQYSFRPAPAVRSVEEMLAHIAVAHRWQMRIHAERAATMDFRYFDDAIVRGEREQAELAGKDVIVDVLEREGVEFGDWLATLTDDVLDERVVFQPTGNPPGKTRFEMLLSVKEHEMHHRAQLMLAERMLGIVPHITAGFQAGLAQLRAARRA